MNLLEKRTLAEKIVDSAQQEVKIELELQNIRMFWSNASLDIQKYSKDGYDKGFKLCSADDLFLQLDDSLLNLQAISSSRHVAFFWEEKSGR
jgi:hypothetical protein